MCDTKIQMKQLLNTKSIVNTNKVDNIDFFQYSKEYINDLKINTLYEVIKGKPVKAYFDYDRIVDNENDIKNKRNKSIKRIHNAMKEYFNQGEQIDMFDASGFNPIKEVWKISFRVIIQNGVLYKNGLYIKDVILPEIKKKINNFDDSVYKAENKMQLLLMPYHHKEGNPDRYFQKVDLTNENYPLIKKQDIPLREFITYSVQSNLRTDDDIKTLDISNNENPDKILNNLVEESKEESKDTEDVKKSKEESKDDKKQKSKKKSKKKAMVDEDKDGETDDINIDEEIIFSYDEIELLVKCLKYEKQEWQWEYWRNLMWCLSNMSVEYNVDLKPLAHEISKESQKYNKCNTDITYNSSKRDETNEYRLAIGSLIQWAKDISKNDVSMWFKKIEENRQKLFDLNEEYYWKDFRNGFTEKIFDNSKKMSNYFNKHINRVMFLTETGEKFIKVNKDEPFCQIKETPSFIIKYILKYIDDKGQEIEELRDYKFKDLYERNINYIRRYDTIINKPIIPAIGQTLRQDKRDFNIWPGFKAKLLPENEVDMKKIEMINNHIKVVWANNDDNIYKFIISWFNHIFTKPFIKSKVALGFQSDVEQIGKSILVESFLYKYVFGKKISTNENGLSFVNERFNEHMMGKIFVCAEELNTISGSDFNATFTALKKILTNATIKIEIKGGRKFEVNDVINLIFFTNERFTIKVGKTDARYFITECNPIYCKNYEYFNRLVECFNQENANHWFSYVYYFKDVVDVRNIPKTNIKREMQLQSLPSTQKFIQKIADIRKLYADDVNTIDVKNDDDDIVVEELSGWKRLVCEENIILSSNLYNYYKLYCNDENERVFTATQFGRDVASMVEKIRKKKGFCYDLNTIKSLD